MPVCHEAHIAVLLGRDVFVGGGYEGQENIKDCYRLDIYNLTILTSGALLLSLHHTVILLWLYDKLAMVTAGGATKNNKVVKKVLVLNAGQWEDYSEMLTDRYCATAVGYHSMVGGINNVEGKWTAVSTTELLDTTNGCWYTCNSIPSPCQQMKAAIMNDKLYLLGGADKDAKGSPQVLVASLDAMSTHQLNWESASNIPFCDSAHVVLYGKFLLTVGGWQQDLTFEVNIFNPSTGQWKHLTNIPAARSAPAVVGVADTIIVIGGMFSNNGNSNTVWIGS